MSRHVSNRAVTALVSVLLLTASLLFVAADAADARHNVVTVRSGDTLSKIANRTDAPGGWERVWYRNSVEGDRGPIKDPNVIRVGWKLTMPHKPRPVFGPRRAPSASRSTTGSSFKVESTAYCLRGTMANGQQVHDGAVAMNGPAFGTKYVVLSGPKDGRTYTVKDSIGHGTQFDIWMSSCDAARQYGRRTITIARQG